MYTALRQPEGYVVLTQLWSLGLPFQIAHNAPVWHQISTLTSSFTPFLVALQRYKGHPFVRSMETEHLPIGSTLLYHVTLLSGWWSSQKPNINTEFIYLLENSTVMWIKTKEINAANLHLRWWDPTLGFPCRLASTPSRQRTSRTSAYLAMVEMELIIWKMMNTEFCGQVGSDTTSGGIGIDT